MTENTPVPDSQVITSLLKLLGEAGKNGRLKAEDFFDFVSILASGRGISVNLHEQGLDAATDAKPHTKLPNEATDKDKRHAENADKKRAYDLGVLFQLLLHLKDNSLLPGNVRIDAVLHDLRDMLDLKSDSNRPRSKPLILSSKSKGVEGIRRSARDHLVTLVYWTASSTGATLKSVRNDKIKNIEEKRWESWVANMGGANGSRIASIKEAGSKGDRAPLGVFGEDKIEDILKLAGL